MIQYKTVKVTINALGLVKIIIKAVVWHHDLSDSIMSDYGLVFTSKFWFSLCYFFEIKQKLLTAFYPQTDGKIERQHSTIEAYL